MITEANDNNFEKEVIEATLPVLVYFGADWCPPCKVVGKIMEAIAKKYDGRLKVVKIDVEEAVVVQKQYGIRALPTLLVFKDGKVVGQFIGAAPQSKIEAEIDKHL